jgi:hypothetical protein
MTTLAAAQRVKNATFRIHAFLRVYNILPDRLGTDRFRAFSTYLPKIDPVLNGAVLMSCYDRCQSRNVACLPVRD